MPLSAALPAGLSSRTEEGQTTSFYLVDGGERGQSEFRMITSGPKEHIVVDVVGVFDVTEVSRLSTPRPK